MTEARCDCGAVVLEVADDPAEINNCQCSWCQRLGALWAYYPKDQVRILSGRDATAGRRRSPSPRRAGSSTRRSAPRWDRGDRRSGRRRSV